MKRIYTLLFFILLLSRSPIYAQRVGNGEVFGFVSSAGPKAPCRFVHAGVGVIALSDTLTFRREKNLHSPQFQFGIGFTYTQLGSKRVSNVPLLAPRNDSAAVSLTNEYGTFFLVARCIAAHNYSGNGFFPYLDFFSGYRILTSYMLTTPYHKLAGYESVTSSFPGKASGLFIGLGAGCHAQARVKKTYILVDSELMWNYCPVRGTIAKTSSLQPDRSGVYVDMENAPNNMLQLKFGICFNTKVESYNNSEAAYNADHPAPTYSGTSSGGTYHGGGHSGGGAHNGVHMSSGGHGGGHAK